MTHFINTSQSNGNESGATSLSVLLFLMGDFNIMWNTTRCTVATLLLLAAVHVLPTYGQLITCIPWMQSRSISCNCSDKHVVFIDDAYLKMAEMENSCSPHSSSNCSYHEFIIEYVRTTCFNKTSCLITFNYDSFTCPGYYGSFYVFIRHRCHPVLDVEGKELLPSAVVGGTKKVETTGIQVMIHSPQYPVWNRASLIQCKMDIPASTVVRLDIMDLSHNSSSSLNFQYNMILGNSSTKRSFRRGTGTDTVFWNNTQKTDTSIGLFFISDDQNTTMNQYGAIFIRFYIFLSVLEFDFSYSKRPVRIYYPVNNVPSGDKDTQEDNATGDVNITMLPDSVQREMRSNDYNIVAVVAGATVGALLLVLVVSIISVILGTRRQRKRRKPPAVPADQELRYHVHANKSAVNKMQAILENHENVSAMQQVKSLNAIIISSSSNNFGTVDSRAPLESHIMVLDAAEDSAYDSSTEPVRSLEDLTFASYPRHPNLQSQDNPLFFSLQKDRDGGRKPARAHSMYLQHQPYDHQYQNHEIIESSLPPRPNSALGFKDHEYVNDFLARRPTRRKGQGPVKRSQSHHHKHPGKHPGRYAKPQRTHSYNTRVDHIKPLERPKDGLYYNTQPQPQLRKNPRRLQTIPSVDGDDLNINDTVKNLSANGKYSFHILGSTQSLSDAVYSYPGSIDRPSGGKDHPKGLLFFSNNSIHAMLQDKRPVPLEDLYAVPQKKKSGFFKLSGTDASPADHEA